MSLAGLRGAHGPVMFVCPRVWRRGEIVRRGSIPAGVWLLLLVLLGHCLALFRVPDLAERGRCGAARGIHAQLGAFVDVGEN
jgi:hypothetical protein